MALYFFLAMACGSIVKSLQIALYLSKVGFDWRLPSLYAVVALICGLIVLLYRYLIRRYSHLDLASGTLGFFLFSIDLPPRTSPPSKLDSEPFEVHSTG